jgi:hypothetical protein
LTASDYKKVDHVLAEFRSGAVVGGVDRTRIIFGSAEIAAIRAVSAMQLDDPRPRRTLDPGRTSPELRITTRSANANSLCGQNSAGFLEIRAIFQRDILPRHF